MRLQNVLIQRTVLSNVSAANLPKSFAAFGLAPEMSLRSLWQVLSALVLMVVTPKASNFLPNFQGMYPMVGVCLSTASGKAAIL